MIYSYFFSGFTVVHSLIDLLKFYTKTPNPETFSSNFQIRNFSTFPSVTPYDINEICAKMYLEAVWQGLQCKHGLFIRSSFVKRKFDVILFFAKHKCLFFNDSSMYAYVYLTVYFLTLPKMCLFYIADISYWNYLISSWINNKLQITVK